MNTHRCVKIGVSLPHDRSSSAASRKACDVNPSRIHRMLAHDLAGDPRDQRRLSLAPALIIRPKPVPAPPRIGQAMLGWIDDEEAVFLGKAIHPGSRSEIIRGLGAAMQHHDQREPLTAPNARNVKLIVP